MTRSRQTADWGSRAGLAKIVPSSVAVGSGTGSADALGTVTFSGASAIALNDVFSSAYKNYRIVIETTGTVGSPTLLYARMRVSNADVSSGYNAEMKFTAYASGSNSFNDNFNTTTSWILGYIPNGGDGRFSASLDLYNPSDSLFKSMSGFSNGTKTGAYLGFGICGGTQGTTSALTGFTIYPASGTATGTISVYGYTI